MICPTFVRWSQVGLVLLASQVATAAMADVPNGMLIAQVMPDETLGNEGSLFIDGGVRDRIEGGATRGENLFHSFEEFNVNTGQEIYFANPVGIENILSRVTGTNLSEIDGLLGVDGVANLFLLNPNGITFGPNAELDIRGSFTASTADTYQFEGAAAPVNILGSDFLTMSVPLGVQQGMRPQGDVTNEGNLAVDAGQSLTLFGDTVLSSSSLAAPAGRVEVLGNRVGVIDQALIDVSGDAGGGTVLVGGDYQGQGDVPNAERTYVGSDTVISADALAPGDGGQVIVWADGDTRFFGDISATGGRELGNGGLVEVSGLEFLDFQGDVDTSAPNGEFGVLLLDPTNIIVVAGNTPNPANASDGFWSTEEDPNPSNQTISVGAINTLLKTNDLTLAASNNVVWNTDATLTYDNVQANRILELKAGTTIFFNGKLISSGAPINVILNSDQDDINGGAIILATNAQLSTSGGDITLRGGSDALDRNGQNVPDSEVILDINAPLQTNNLLTSENASLENPNNAHFAPGTLARKIFARGNTISRNGIRMLESSTLDAAGGDILLLGGGTNEPLGNGIHIERESRVTTSGTGQIRMVGLGGLGLDNEIGLENGEPTTLDSSSVGLRLINFSDISSENGNIQLIGYAAGTGVEDVGIWIWDGKVQSSGSGNISLVGISDSISGSNNEGISVFSNGSVEANGTGNISLNGIGAISHIGNESGSSSTNPGIHISVSANISAKAGDVVLTGLGRAIGLENYGVQLNGNGSVVAGGNISIMGAGGSNGADSRVTNSELLTGSAAGIRIADTGSIKATGSNEDVITLIADEIVLQSDRVSQSIFPVSGNGVLRIQPRTPNLGIVVGGTSEDDDQLNLGVRDIEALEDGFSEIVIGSFREEPDSFPVTVIGDSVFQDSVKIQASSINASSNATILGNDLDNDASITLKARDGIVSPNIIAPGQSLILESSNGRILLDHSSILAPPTVFRGSSIVIRGNDFIMNSATIDTINSETALNSANSLPTSISIEVDNSVSLIDSSILSLTNGSAVAGDISVIAGDEVSLEGLSRIGTIALSNASGDGGDIQISANSLRLENGGQLSASTFSDGDAGNIEIIVKDRIIVSGVVSELGPSIPSSTSFQRTSFPETLNEDNNVNFSDVIPHISQSIPTGDKAVVYDLEISEPGTSVIFDLDNGISKLPIQLDIRSPNNTEGFEVTQNNILEIFDEQGNLLISNEGVPNSFGAAGSDNGFDPYIRYTFSKAGSYSIRVSARQLEENFRVINLTGGDPTKVLINVARQDLNQVNSTGQLNPDSPILHISLLNTSFESQSGIFSTTSDQGSAGEISISTPQLNISNGGQVSVLTNNNGTGGTIKIESDEINLSDNGSEILASTSGAAPGGSIVLLPNISSNIEINTIGDGPQISASTAPGSSGTGGNITIQNAEIAKLDNTELLTRSDGSGQAGNINVQNVDVLLMRRGSLIQAGASDTGSGGNVDIDAGFVVTVPNENNDILANARENAGGNIDITANRIIGFREVDQFSDRLRENSLSDISARSRLGTDGEVDINNLFIDPNQGLNELPSTLVDPANRIAQGCRAAQTDQLEETSAAGDFIITGRGGQTPGPANPGGSDITPLDDFGPIDAQTNASSPTTAISETPDDSPKELKDSQAAIMTESGNVFLVASDGWDSSISCSALH